MHVRLTVRPGLIPWRLSVKTNTIRLSNLLKTSSFQRILIAQKPRYPINQAPSFRVDMAPNRKARGWFITPAPMHCVLLAAMAQSRLYGSGFRVPRVKANER